MTFSGLDILRGRSAVGDLAWAQRRPTARSGDVEFSRAVGLAGADVMAVAVSASCSPELIQKSSRSIVDRDFLTCFDPDPPCDVFVRPYFHYHCLVCY